MKPLTISLQSRALLKNSFQRNASQSLPKKTCLFDFHQAHQAKMVEFGGWLMPVCYADQSVGESHLHTRNHCSIFDVSHIIAFIEKLTVADVQGLKEHRSVLTLFTNDNGGIKDDLIITKDEDHLFLVSNAACSDKDIAHMKLELEHFKKDGRDVTVEHLDNRALIAVQGLVDGPEMIKVVQAGVKYDMRCLFFMSSVVTSVFDIPNCRLSRCGYTGEDGVEISIDSDRAVELCQKILNSTQAPVKLAGLGARDSLRLEAAMCLYGTDMDETTTPVEASLSWLIARRRREMADFPGADIIMKQLKSKEKNISKKRVGMISTSGRPPRGNYDILSPNGDVVIGKVTSGCPSPVLKENVAMGYVNSEYTKVGTQLKVDCSGNRRKQFTDASVTKMPFVAHRFYNASERDKLIHADGSDMKNNELFTLLEDYKEKLREAETKPSSVQLQERIINLLRNFQDHPSQMWRDFCFEFLPSLIECYLLSRSSGLSNVSLAVGTLLITIYNCELQNADGSLKKEVIRLPPTTQPSIFIRDPSNSTIFERLTEKNVLSLNTESVHHCQIGPHLAYSSINASNRFLLLTNLLKTYNSLMDKFSLMSIESYCAMCYSICRSGFQFETLDVLKSFVGPGLRRQEQNLHHLMGERPNAPRILLSSYFLVEAINGLQHAMFGNACVSALLAIESIHLRAKYELYTDVLLVTNSILNSLETYKNAGMTLDSLIGIYTACSPAVQVHIQRSPGLITKASFKLRKFSSKLMPHALSNSSSPTGSPCSSRKHEHDAACLAEEEDDGQLPTTSVSSQKNIDSLEESVNKSTGDEADEGNYTSTTLVTANGDDK
ncbi:Aminomethyltransferase, mitochondrial [Trichinella pseudospiralis]|uniref:Aminomethyltransferase, mitochondrial n=1 Tax=Trichinella pseudospiralis TaxID=6337 RepID=A0A0V1EQG8_TRIPS|nr:Aminomethyltransferase, mitochondrial [Trichinella pseudospiralis]KRY89966.1 Aminomethyltransferase, mitochondrial [Trichinella pseudospiralis]